MKAALFDMDGVLVDTQKYHIGIYKQIAKEYNITIDDKTIESLGGVLKEEATLIMCKVLNIEPTKNNLDALYKRKNSLYKEKIRSIKQGLLMEGAIELLEKLSKNNVPMALCSASSNAPEIVKLTGLDKYFDKNHIVDLKKVAKGKPNPEIFLRGAILLNTDPKDCVVYEDAVNGIQAAKRAGMYSIGYNINLDHNNLTYGDTTADRVVKSLSDPLCYRGLYDSFASDAKDCNLFVFDAGNVVINNIECLADIINEYNPTEKQIDEFLFDFKSYSAPLLDGSISTEDYWKHVEKCIGIKVNGNPFEKHFNPTLNQPVIDVINKLQNKGYRVALGSNIFTPHANVLERIGVTKYFDKCYMSHIINNFKPSLGFFRHICENENLKPDEIFFIDDLDENIAAAAKFGFKTLHYANDYKNEKLQQVFSFLD